MWKKRWTSAGTQGITAAGPVDSQRILRMSAESLVRASAQEVETHSPPNADTEPGETSETAGNPETGYSGRQARQGRAGSWHQGRATAAQAVGRRGALRPR